MADFVIREVVPDDALNIIAYLKDLADETPNTIALSSAAEVTLTEDRERGIIADHTAADNCIFIVVESAERHLIGMANCTGGNTSADYHSANLGISLHRDWRGRGIGRLVMHTMIEWAQNNPVIHRLELKVFTHNARAIHLYKSMGFQQEVHLHETLLKYGEWRDSYVMAMLFERETYG